MARDSNSEQLHNKLIKAMVRKLEADGYENIRADHINYAEGAPDSYGGNTPDISTSKNAHTNIVIEAETLDSLDDTDTKEQLQVLSTIPNTKFWIIVPLEVVPILKARLKEWSIFYDEIFSLAA